MRNLSVLGLVAALLLPPGGLRAQEAPGPLATLHLADGTSVALLEWKLSYEYVVWRKKDRVANATSQASESSTLLLGKKSYPMRGETLSLTHEPKGDSFRVVSMTLKKAGKLKIERPDKGAIAPDLAKDFNYRPYSLDISGKTLSGMDRGFCIVSFWPLVDCGASETTRVVRIDFN